MNYRFLEGRLAPASLQPVRSLWADRQTIGRHFPQPSRFMAACGRGKAQFGESPIRGPELYDRHPGLKMAQKFADPWALIMVQTFLPSRTPSCVGKRTKETNIYLQ